MTFSFMFNMIILSLHLRVKVTFIRFPWQLNKQNNKVVTKFMGMLLGLLTTLKKRKGVGVCNNLT